MKKQLESKQEKLDVQRKSGSSVKPTKKPIKILADAKEYADQTMKDCSTNSIKIMDTAAIENERQNLRNRINKAEKGMSMNTTEKKPKKELKPKDLPPGRYRSGTEHESQRNCKHHPGFQRLIFLYRWVSSVPKFIFLIWSC